MAYCEWGTEKESGQNKSSSHQSSTFIKLYGSLNIIRPLKKKEIETRSWRYFKNEGSNIVEYITAWFVSG